MKRFFSFLLIALMASAVVVSCNKDEDTSSNTTNNGGNGGGNGGGGGTPTVADGISVKFMGNTWTAGYMSNYWVLSYEQIFYQAAQHADAADNQENTFPFTDGWVYPSTSAEQDYFCNYYIEGAYDISSSFGQAEGTIVVGDYFWYPGISEDANMALANVNFDAASLTVNDMKLTIPMFNTQELLGSQDYATTTEEVTFHNVALTEAGGDSKSCTKKNVTFQKGILSVAKHVQK